MLQFWPSEATSDCPLCSFNKPHYSGDIFLLSGSYSIFLALVLEQKASLRSSVFLYWWVGFRNQDLGIGCAHGSGVPLLLISLIRQSQEIDVVGIPTYQYTHCIFWYSFIRIWRNTESLDFNLTPPNSLFSFFFSYFFSKFLSPAVRNLDVTIYNILNNFFNFLLHSFFNYICYTNRTVSELLTHNPVTLWEIPLLTRWQHLHTGFFFFGSFSLLFFSLIVSGKELFSKII